MTLLLWALLETAHAQEMFKVQVFDRKMHVEGPAKPRARFAVAVDNQSLSPLTGKFIAGGKDLKFVSVPSGEERIVEFQHEGTTPVRFRPLSPPFQEAVLEFGKRPYEIPPQQ